MSSDIKVTVTCTVYNHEKFLSKCLESLSTQKTNFKYEVLVHDDCSTDNSRKIIKEYQERYPEIIIPIFATENQFSKKINFMQKIFLPRARGKYIAQCEGDDYWCDENKLQRQYDFMESHEDCNMCVHNSWIKDLSSDSKSRKKFNNWKKVHEMTDKDVFSGWNVHTSSYFIRKTFVRRPDDIEEYWFGDYVTLTLQYCKGKIYCLPEIMSVYNFNNSQGVTYQKNHTDMRKRVNKEYDRIKYLEYLNKHFDYRFNDIISKQIGMLKFGINALEIKYNIKTAETVSEKIKAAKQARKDPNYKLYYNNQTFKNKLILIFKFRGYVLYPLWNFLWSKVD